MIEIDEIKSIIVESGVVINVEEMKADVPLRDQGVDSLDLLNFFFLIEEKYDISIPEEEIDELKTMNEIILYVSERSPKVSNSE